MHVNTTSYVITCSQVSWLPVAIIQVRTLLSFIDYNIDNTVQFIGAIYREYPSKMKKST